MGLKKIDFFISGMTCNACVATAENALSAVPGIHNIKIFPVQNGPTLASVVIDDNHVLPSDLSQIIENIGFTFSQILDEAECTHKNNIHRHWIYGGIGVSLGILILLIMVFAGPLPLIAMISLGVISVLITLFLSLEFLWKAKNQIQRGEPAMDTLFAISTAIVVAVSITAFFVPWLPMMFDVGLLIFGFRHLGLAIKETLFEATGVKKSLQSNAMEIVPKQQPDGQYLNVRVMDLRPGDVIRIEPGDKMIPVDGFYDGDQEHAPVLLKTHITGAILPAKLEPEECILSGMMLMQQQPILMKVRGVPGEVFSVMSSAPDMDAFAHEQHLIIYNNSKGINVASRHGNTVTSHSLKNIDIEEIQTFTREKIAGLPVNLHKQIINQIPNFTPQQKTSSYLGVLDQSIQDSERTKASVQKKTERFLQYYFIPLVLFIACASAVLLSIFVSPATAILCAISVLVSACPCTLGLITPLSMFVGMKKAQGIRFQHADALEKASQVRDVIFDLNGTLTEGKPEVVSCNINTSDLQCVFAMEQHSIHPIGQAIARYAASTATILDCKSQVDPDGVQAIINCTTYILGNESMLNKHAVETPQISLEPGDSIIYLADITTPNTQHYLGHLVLRDRLREHALDTVKTLQKNGVAVHMCTGADLRTAQTYASYLGITQIKANERNKEEYVRTLIKDQNKKLLFIGDALNDATALSFVRNNGGVSMVLQHNHAAQESASGLLQCADVLMNAGSLLAIPRFLEVSQQTMSNINFNLLANLTYNILITLLCAGVLVSLGIVLHPVIGVIIMSAALGLMLLSVFALQQQSLTWVTSVHQDPITNNTISPTA